MGDLTKNFSRWEFECPCCREYKMQESTIARLQHLRTRYGKPISVVNGGGFRCERYPGSDTSAHKEGRAVDLGFPQADLYEVQKIAMDVGFVGIGIKSRDGQWQLHVDDAGTISGKRPRPWVWTYE